MIRISRTYPAPDILTRLGTRQTERDCAAFEKTPEEYGSRERRFPNRDYYSNPEVKGTLLEMHNHKCCYCEMKLYTAAYLHVEHFRPKGAVRQSRIEDDEFPGYFWLAYSWENLLLACFDCNTRYKGTLFPLENRAQRARSREHDLTMERELFVNPAEEDPREHIRFEDDLPVALTERGGHTIEGLGLRRSELFEQRLHVLKLVKLINDMIMIIDAADRDKALRFLEKAVKPDAEFSSMVMDYLVRQQF